MNILFFGQKGHWATNKCLDYFAIMQCRVDSYLGMWGDALPEDLGWIEHDLIVSFLSPWIIPEFQLCRARIGAINFHPGIPEYPGLGGVSFSIYEGKTQFGVTCHHMEKKPFGGGIVAVKRFPIFPDDSAETLTNRCHHYMLAMFIDIVGFAVSESRIEVSDENWARVQYTRSQVDGLRCIDPSMSPEEARRRVWATSESALPGAYINVGGFRFEAKLAD